MKKTGLPNSNGDTIEMLKTRKKAQINGITNIYKNIVKIILNRVSQVMHFELTE